METSRQSLTYIINHLLTSAGKSQACANYAQKGFASDIPTINNAINHYQRERCYYLAGNLLENEARIYRDKCLNADKDYMSTKLMQFSEKTYYTNIGSLEKIADEFIEKAVHFYEEGYLYDYASKLFVGQAEQHLQMAKYEEEQSEIFKSKHAYEKAKKSPHTARYYIKISKFHHKREKYFILHAINYYEKAVLYYQKSGLYAQATQTERKHQLTQVHFVKQSKGLDKAIKLCIKKGWNDLAAELYRKSKDLGKAEFHLKKYQAICEKFGNKGRQIELDGKVLESDARALEKRSKEYKDKNESHVREYENKKTIIHYLLIKWTEYKAKRLLFQSFKLLEKAAFCYENAKAWYVKAQMQGKVSECEAKVKSFARQFGGYIIRAENAKLAGDVVGLNQVNQQLTHFIKTVNKSERDHYLQRLIEKKKYIEKLIQLNQEAEKWEIRGDKDKNNRYYIKAMEYYEEAGNFKIAGEIALKAGKTELSDIYRILVISVN